MVEMQMYARKRWGRTRAAVNTNAHPEIEAYARRCCSPTPLALLSADAHRVLQLILYDTPVVVRVK